jgi:ankyrin repeat protein
VEGIHNKQSIHYACERGHLHITQWLVEAHGISVAAETSGSQPMHFACTNNHLPVAEWLVAEKGASLNARTNKGTTPLHCACGEGHLAMVKWIVAQDNELVALRTHKHGDLKPGYGNATPMQWAELNDHHAVVDFLRTTPYHVRAEKEKAKSAKEEAEWLVAEKAKAHDQEAPERASALMAQLGLELDRGSTPLHIACHYGHLATVEWIVEQDSGLVALRTHKHGWDVGYGDATPLQFAELAGHKAVVDYLRTTPYYVQVTQEYSTMGETIEAPTGETMTMGETPLPLPLPLLLPLDFSLPLMGEEDNDTYKGFAEDSMAQVLVEEGTNSKKAKVEQANINYKALIIEDIAQVIFEQGITGKLEEEKAIYKALSDAATAHMLLKEEIGKENKLDVHLPTRLKLRERNLSERKTRKTRKP